MSNNIGNNLNIINNNLVNGATLGLGGTVRSRLTLNPDYFTFSAISAGELTLDFDSPYTFDWDEYKLTILDASNNNVLNEPVIIRSDRTITANLPKGGLYTLMVEAAEPQYPLPNADYGITATTFVRVKPTVSIQPLNTLIREGTVSNGGPMEYTQFTFKIILSDLPDTAETVSYSIYGISDFIDINDFEPASPFSGRSISTAKSASVSFAKNQTEQTIIVAVAKDSLEEANEQFRVQLNNPSSGIKLADIDSEVAVILNDDFTSYASIANITAGGVLEGTGTGFTTHRFEVTLNKPTLSEQTLDYMIVFGTDGADKSDFSPQAPTSQAAKVIFAPGASKATIDVEIAKDSIVEAFESYAVRLSNPSTQLALGTAEAQGLIVNDDMGLLVSWNSETQRAPNEGKSLTFRVKTNQSMTSDQRIEWRIDGTTKLDDATYIAASSADFKASSGSFIFPKNKKEASFTVETLNDDLVEGPELAKVLLTLPSGLTMDPNGNEKYIIVTDNNTHPEITISQKNINEGTRATPTNFVIDLATSKAVSYIQTFNWALEATGDSPASQDDFVGNAFPSGTIIIPANSKKASISIPIVADPYAELSDNFNLVITGSNGFTTKIFPLEITNDDGVIGTKNKDTLYGKKNDDLINGLDGNDTIYSNEVKGNYVIGGNGDDIIIDGGENLVRCDAGNDTVSLFYPTDGGGRINGGAGIDHLSLTFNIYQLNTSTGLVNAVDPGTRTFSIQFSEFEKYSMSASNMTVNGSSRDEFFQYKPSLSGNNTAVFTGGGGSDTFNLSNVISSSERANAIFTINDFSLLNDKITIAGAGKGQFLQVKEFSNKARQMIIETKLNESTVYIDSNGDRTADITINLIGTFNASDLLITAS